MPQALLNPNGSYGDVYPFLAIGEKLVDRGWEVKFRADDFFREQAEGCGLEFVSSGAAEDFHAQCASANVQNPIEFLNEKKSRLNRRIRDSLNYALERVESGTVVLAPPWEMGFRIAKDLLPIKLATVHLQPLVFRSVYDLPVLPSWLPKAGKRTLLRIVDYFIDSLFAKEINQKYEQHGLRPVTRVAHQWWHSPDLVLAMFPEWFAAPQPDWPPNTFQAGFPLYSKMTKGSLNETIELLLQEGKPALVFSGSSAMNGDSRFFSAAVEAAQLLNLNAVLLTPHTELIPDKLPVGVIHAAYADHRLLLPRCHAFIHNGGIGATAEGLLAGCPQVIADVGNDQGDNAMRAERIGVARRISVKSITGPKLAKLLDELIGSPETLPACERYAQLTTFEGIDRACDAIERLVEKTAVVAR